MPPPLRRPFDDADDRRVADAQGPRRFDFVPAVSTDDPPLADAKEEVVLLGLDLQHPFGVVVERVDRPWTVKRPCNCQSIRLACPRNQQRRPFGRAGGQRWRMRWQWQWQQVIWACLKSPSSGREFDGPSLASVFGHDLTTARIPANDRLPAQNRAEKTVCGTNKALIHFPQQRFEKRQLQSWGRARRVRTLT